MINSYRFRRPGLPTGIAAPVAYWKLDESSGQRNDSVGSLHLTDNNTVASQTGKQGNAAELVAANNEYLNAGSGLDPVTFGNTDFSIACWVKFTTVTGNQGIVNGNAGALKGYLLYLSAGDLLFLVGDDGGTFAQATASSFGTPSTGIWYFIAAIHDSVNNLLKICVNDGTVNTSAFSNGSATALVDFNIGRYTPGGFPLDALADEVGLWNKVLDAAEITALYNSGNGVTYS